jgi:hypothetical protein
MRIKFTRDNTDDILVGLNTLSGQVDFQGKITGNCVMLIIVYWVAINTRNLGFMYTYYSSLLVLCNWSRWSRGIKLGSYDARLLELRVRIPPVVGSLSCECYVLSGRFSKTAWLFVRRIPTRCGVSECNREALTMGSRWPTRSCRDMNKNFELCRPDLKLLHMLLELEGFVTSKININIAKSVQ